MARARWANHKPTANNLTADDFYHRMLHDRRGYVIREGVTYKGDGQVIPWQVCYSINGRTDQFDILVNGNVWKTCGQRRLNRLL